MKKITLSLVALAVLGWQGISFADSSVDALIQKLEDKGILTNQEASQIKDEVSNNEQENIVKVYKTQIPDWITNLKISGDFRLRDQLQQRDVKGGTSAGDNLDQNRGRFRARLNFEDQINDKMKLVVGIATNGEKSGFPGNSRSNNITFGGNASGEGSFNKSTLVLNKAYAVYTPSSWATLMGGQMDNPIWEPANLLWDPDITPVGGAVQLQKKLNDYITPFSTTGFFVLRDSTPAATGATAAKTDPYIFFTQDGIKGNLTEKVYYKAAATYYDVNNPTRNELDSSNTTNTTQGLNTGTGGIYKYNYYLVGGAVDLGMNDPFGELLPSPIYVPQVGVFGQFFRNVDLSSSEGQANAWMAGAYMGNSAINGWGTWKIQSYYKVLEKDSWLDALPDDDFYSGDTDVAGWRNQLDIGLAKNVWLTFSYFHTYVYKPFSLAATPTGAFTTKAPENLFQFDLNMKF